MSDLSGGPAGGLTGWLTMQQGLAPVINSNARLGEFLQDAPINREAKLAEIQAQQQANASNPMLTQAKLQGSPFEHQKFQQEQRQQELARQMQQLQFNRQQTLAEEQLRHNRQIESNQNSTQTRADKMARYKMAMDAYNEGAGPHPSSIPELKDMFGAPAQVAQQQPGMQQPGQSPIFGGEYGLPRVPMSRKEMAVQQRQEYLTDSKMLEKKNQEISGLDSLNQGLDRWLALNRTTTTGPIVGMATQFTTEGMQLKQLENMLSMNNFKPGQGQMSNYERALIKGAGPNMGFTEEANQNIVTLMKSSIERAKEKNQFQQMYLQAKGKLLGSDAAWSKYINSNPMYIEGADGKLTRNPEYQAWYEWDGKSHLPKKGESKGGVQDGAIAEGPNGRMIIMRNGQWQNLQ